MLRLTAVNRVCMSRALCEQLGWCDGNTRRVCATMRRLEVYGRLFVCVSGCGPANTVTSACSVPCCPLPSAAGAFQLRLWPLLADSAAAGGHVCGEHSVSRRRIANPIPPDTRVSIMYLLGWPACPGLLAKDTDTSTLTLV